MEIISTIVRDGIDDMAEDSADNLGEKNPGKLSYEELKNYFY